MPSTRRRLLRGATAALVVSLIAVAACGSGGDDSGDQARSRAQLVYVALGDSYSSGAGAPPYDRDASSCERSEEAWARRLATDSPRIRSLDHRACAGAQVQQLLEPWSERLQPAQIAQQPDLQVGLVTLTAGGNDVGFGTLMIDCFTGDCPSPTDPGFAARLATLAVTLDQQVYPALRRAYPNARLIHVGYPILTAPRGAPVGCDWMSESDQAAIPAFLEAINATVRGAAEHAGITYVDVSDAVAGHELCTSDSWIQPIGNRDPVHPNAVGQRAIEHRVADALGLPLDETRAG